MAERVSAYKEKLTMANTIKMYDFVGFSFNGVSSKELKIMRVSDGTRYEEKLSAEFADRVTTNDSSGKNYYFGVDLKEYKIPINIAFDSLTESDMRKLRETFAPNKVGNFIFDETPYKVQKAKIATQVTLKYVCFDEKGQRIYKGEGTIDLISYDSYAKTLSEKKYRNDYINYSNFSEWIDSSRLREKGNYDTYIKETKRINLYNAGDIEAPFKLYLDFTSGALAERLPALTISIGADKILKLNAIPIDETSEDVGVRINTKTNLIEGYNAKGEITGSYNWCLESGTFFDIPLNESSLQLSNKVENVKIEYDYLYY